VFSVVYNCNYLLSGFVSLELFVIFSLIILGLFSFLYLKHFRGSRIGDIGFVFIFIGGLLNSFSWLKEGCVKDYINFFNLFHFNFADLMITTGVFFVLIRLWKKK
jgi:lipoprotein signal peptidase